jgi:uncharacterized protein YjbJ (UPF0337 family)
MSIENRAKAIAKNLEGQAQEFKGEVTGNERDKAVGQAKQAESELRHQAEKVKEKGHRDTTGAENRVEATAKNIEGKIQEFVGDLTGDPQIKAEGQAKQAEAKLRHTVENIKDNLR